jgi:[protein-PII] uridylyltransferase
LAQAVPLNVREHDPHQLLARTEAVDSIVKSAVVEHFQAKFNAPYAMAAVGGYGRRELFPYSDVDLLVLTAGEADVAAIKEPLSEFLRVLWDSGLRLSHSVRTPAECCRFHEDNIELHISLLDLRFVGGDEELFRRFSQQLPESFQRHAPVLLRHLMALTRHRHNKYNNTPYHLEPNVKESPGGIRDIHLLRWLSQLLPRQEFLQESLAEFTGGTGGSPTVMVRDSAQDFLFSLRCFLHTSAKRDANLLTFDMQDEAARVLPEEPMQPEAWMRMYFKHARRVYQCSLRALEYVEGQDASLLRQFRDWRNRLSTPEFTISRERVFLRNPSITLGSADAVLRLFSFTGRHGLQLSWDTQRRIRQEIGSITQSFRNQPPAWNAWRDLFSQPHTALALAEMQETGVLAAAIPPWHSVDSLVVRDFYHRYTVDEHTIVAIQVIDQLLTATEEVQQRFHQLAIEEDELPVLRLAMLLHDLGKGITPGDHIRGSICAARQVMQTMGTPEGSQATVLFLIGHHLDLSLVMNGRDLEDPATARFLTSQVHTQEDLRRLALLTYADISAVNPTAMTPWRLEQLWRVYALGLEQLTRELASDRIHDHLFAAGDPFSERLAAFLDGFPRRYVRTHSREQIGHHLQLAAISKKEGVAVEITREAGAYLMAVLTHDRPGLFASLCGVLASFGMNIVKGEASSNAQRCILDLIRFTDPLHTLELNPEEVNRLQWTVECVVRGSVQVSDLLKRRRPARRPASDATIVPSVRFNNEASDYATLIDFVGEDRPGLLYDLASAISAAGCNLEVAMIDTEAHKALDVFYVTRESGKLDESELEQLQADLLKAAAQA